MNLTKKSIDDHIKHGRWAITDVKNAGNSFESRQRYAQTLNIIDLALKGWDEVFAYGNSPNTLDGLDQAIDEKLNRFRSWYASQIRNTDWKTRRRTGGVCLLGDISSKKFEDLPFKLDGTRRFVQSQRTLTISTDGSVLASGRQKGKDQGPGGWAFLVHETSEEISGCVESATNNQMELRAVIEAIRHIGIGHSIKIRTDSQYVSDAISNGKTSS